MRLAKDTQILLVIIISFLPLGFSRPSFGRRSALYELLSRRTSYSIVPVDGGASANSGTDSPDSATSRPVPPTFTTIAVAATQTSTEIDTVTLPPLTNYITSTRIIEGATITQVTEVTITSPASQTTITKTRYSIINISSPSPQISSSTETSGSSIFKSTDYSLSPSSFSQFTTIFPTQTPGPELSQPQTLVSSLSSQHSLNSTQSTTGPLATISPQSTQRYSSNSSIITYGNLASVTSKLAALQSL